MRASLRSAPKIYPVLYSAPCCSPDDPNSSNREFITLNTMKPPKACHECRRTKRRCTRRSGQVGDSCDQCQMKSLKCTASLANVPARTHALLPNPSPTRHQDTSIDVPVDVAIRLVDYYLTKLHNRPHSLFHPATLKKQVQNGSVNKALLLSICSMGARFDADDDVRSLESTYNNESKRLLLADLENICIENVQTCILIANLYAAHLNPSSEALFFRKLHQRRSILPVTYRSQASVSTCYKSWKPALVRRPAH